MKLRNLPRSSFDLLRKSCLHEPKPTEHLVLQHLSTFRFRHASASKAFRLPAPILFQPFRIPEIPYLIPSQSRSPKQGRSWNQNFCLYGMQDVAYIFFSQVPSSQAFNFLLTLAIIKKFIRFPTGRHFKLFSFASKFRNPCRAPQCPEVPSDYRLSSPVSSQKQTRAKIIWRRASSFITEAGGSATTRIGPKMV